MKQMTIKQFNERFPNNDACLDEIFTNRYGKLKACPNCAVIDVKWYRLSGRKAYSCEYCRYQLHPLAGTIFHKSSTELKNWLFALYLFSVSKNGVSAKELQRQLGVTYKCAHRIAGQIRKLMDNHKDTQLKGTVEVDETYMGGRQKGKTGRRANDDKKIPVMGMVERGGRVRARKLNTVSTPTVIPPIRYHVKDGSKIMTDELGVYNVLDRMGYKHGTIKHKETYVQGNIHTNTIEGFWSQLKRSVSGTYHSVSPQHLQSYVNEFAYRYSQRQNPNLFDHLLGRLVAERLS